MRENEQKKSETLAAVNYNSRIQKKMIQTVLTSLRIGDFFFCERSEAFH